MTGLATRDKRPNLHFDLTDPETGINYGCPPKGWRFEPATMNRKIAEKRVLWPSDTDGRPRQKLFLNEMESIFKNISSVIQNIATGDGTREVNSLIGSGIFSFPKPTRLIEIFLEQATDKDSIVVDFFAGSASTAHAVLKKNADDGGNRRFIMVQLPEACIEDSEAFKAGYKTIAEVSKERIRLAGKQIKEGVRSIETGFRVLKIAPSNMADVYYAPDRTQQDLLSEQINNIKPDRTPEDLLFQVMLDWGVDLALPIAKQSIQGKEVFFVDGNALAACFDASGSIDEAFVKELAKHQPLRVVFRDAGYKNSAVKTNVEQIFKLMSPATEVKCI